MHPDTICALPPTNLKNWVIDPARTLVIVPDYPNQTASTALMLWLAKRFDNIQPFSKKDVVAMRNTVIRDLKRRTFDDYLLVDNDMYPTLSTDYLFEAKADIVCVQCNHGCEGAWARPDDFHCNAFRFSKKVLDAIALPWFMKTYNVYGTEQTGCSCQHFREKALAAGFTIQRAGWMRHGSDGR